jgi:uncharacterized protein (DUF1015 family)
VVEDSGFRRAARSAIVVAGDRMQQLGQDRRVELDCRRALLDRAQPEVDVSEQATLGGRREGRPAAELADTADVVEERRGDEQVGAQPRVELRRLAAECRDADGVLEQAACVAVVTVGSRGRQRAEAAAHGRIGEHRPDEGREAWMRELRGEEVEKTLELVGVAAKRGSQRSRILVLGRLHRAQVKLQPVAELLDAPEHAHGVALREAAVEELDVAPDPCLDPPARVDELEREVRSTRPGRPPLLPRDAVDALDDAVGGELGDRRHGAESRQPGRWYGPGMADVQPFRALRYGAAAGPLDRLVAPPYDVLSVSQRDELAARSPHNVVRLTLPDSEEEAARLVEDWRRDGMLVEEPAAVWVLQQDFVGPDGVARTRTGLVASLRVEPYDRRVVLPHERTHAGPKEGRLRLLRATGVQLEPIFLLYDGPQALVVPDRPPDVAVEGARLWRIGDAGDAVASFFADKQLLIADGHHRYETALAYAAERGTPEAARMLVVLVSTSDPGLEIFPTHRVFSNGATPPDAEAAIDVEAALAELEGLPYDRSAAVLYRDREAGVVRGEAGELDVQLVDRIAHEDIAYTPDWRDAVARVDRGEGTLAALLRPTRIEDVFAVARRGEVLPQKTTYFYPKLLSGLLLHPVE